MTNSLFNRVELNGKYYDLGDRRQAKKFDSAWAIELKKRAAAEKAAAAKTATTPAVAVQTPKTPVVPKATVTPKIAAQPATDIVQISTKPVVKQAKAVIPQEAGGPHMIADAFARAEKAKYLKEAQARQAQRLVKPDTTLLDRINQTVIKGNKANKSAKASAEVYTAAAKAAKAKYKAGEKAHFDKLYKGVQEESKQARMALAERLKGFKAGKKASAKGLKGVWGNVTKFLKGHKVAAGIAAAVALTATVVAANSNNKHKEVANIAPEQSLYQPYQPYTIPDYCVRYC